MNTINENTDDFVKRAVKIASLEKPGDGFVPSLMDKIESLNIAGSELPATSSIISPKGWVFIGLVITSIFTMLFLSDSTASGFPVFDYPFDKITSMFSSLSISRIFLTGLSAFVFYFIIQISLVVGRVNGTGKINGDNIVI